MTPPDMAALDTALPMPVTRRVRGSRTLQMLKEVVREALYGVALAFLAVLVRADVGRRAGP